MTAGIQIFNDAGYVQIDDTYKNLHFIRKEDNINLTWYNTGQAKEPSTWHKVFFNAETTGYANGFLAAIRGNNNTKLQYAYFYQNGSSTPKQMILDIVGDRVSNYTAYIYGYPISNNSSNFCVYNSAGEITFSGGNIMRVIGSYVGEVTAAQYGQILVPWNEPYTNYRTPVVVQSIPYNRSTTAVIIGSQSTYFDYNFSLQKFRVYYQHVRFTDTTIDIVIDGTAGSPNNFMISETSFSNTNTTHARTKHNPYWHILLIDVTGL